MAEQPREPNPTRTQYVYVVRVWQEASQLTPTGQWRGSVEDVATSRRTYFADLDQLSQWLEQASGWQHPPHRFPLPVHSIVVVQDTYRRWVDAVAGALAEAWEATHRHFGALPPHVHIQSCAALFAWVVGRLHDVDALTPALHRYTRRSSISRWRAEHYSYFGEALLSALDARLGPEFTPEIRRAWFETYLLITALVVAGAATGR